LREQLDSQQQEQSDWTSSVGDNLDTAIGGVQGTTVTNVDNTVNIKVGNNGLFSPGGIALSAGGSQLLSTIAQQLSALDANINVVGHTDNIPVGNNRRFTNNDELSLARAVSTLQFLRDQGIQAEQLSASGYGDRSPVAGNDTAEGRAQNRRVEIVLRKP
jgi:chemotaxis protein MotB